MDENLSVIFPVLITIGHPCELCRSIKKRVWGLTKNRRRVYHPIELYKRCKRIVFLGQSQYSCPPHLLKTHWRRRSEGSPSNYLIPYVFEKEMRIEDARSQEKYIEIVP
jgi:hypothetical protein